VKRIIVWVLGCCLLVCSGAQAGEIERIQAKGEIVVSLNRGTPPFCMEVKGELTGLDVDLALLLADYLGVKPRFRFPDAYEEHIPSLLAGEADIVIAAMTRTPERGLRVNFTEPYFEVSQAALVRRDWVGRDDQSYFDLVGIKGLRVGVKQHTTIENFARELFPKDAVKTYASHGEAVDGLVRGEVEATVHDSPFVHVWEKAHPELVGKFKALLAPTTQEHYGFAIRKGDSDFLQWLNLFIGQVQTDGTMELLKHRYLVEMSWLGITPTREIAMSKAQLLRNQFLSQKQEMIERKRQETMKTAGARY
jgi:polar amino acid transport system substrate-binding protein